MKNKGNKLAEAVADYVKRGLSYNHCGLCGFEPEADQAPNRSPFRWWDQDDGWKITSLCQQCHADTYKVAPQSADYAYDSTNGLCDFENVDVDPIDAL